MNTGPEHEAVQEMLAAAALGTLEDAELQRVAAHTSDCPECARLCQEYRQVAANLALMLPAQRLDPVRSLRTKARLLSRVRAEMGTGTIKARQPDRWAGWLVAAGLAGILLVHHSVHRPLAYGWLAAGILTVVLVGVVVYARTQRQRASTLRKHLAEHERKNYSGPSRRPA